MNKFQKMNLERVLLAFVLIGMLLASPAHSAVAGVSAATIAKVAQPSLGTFDSGENAVLETNHTSSVSLPPLATLAPSQKWGALFPVFGVVAAVAVTQLLRRRRLAQLRSDSSFGQ